jgi:hypothetical protein
MVDLNYANGGSLPSLKIYMIIITDLHDHHVVNIVVYIGIPLNLSTTPSWGTRGIPYPCPQEMSVKR